MHDLNIDWFGGTWQDPRGVTGRSSARCKRQDTEGKPIVYAAAATVRASARAFCYRGRNKAINSL
jgi:hypothetical protein